MKYSSCFGFPGQQPLHDDVIKWKHFPRYWPFVRGIHRSPVNSPHKDQWRGALMWSLICVWINGWVNNREAGDLRPHRVHYDVTVMANHHFDPTCAYQINLFDAWWRNETTVNAVMSVQNSQMNKPWTKKILWIHRFYIHIYEFINKNTNEDWNNENILFGKIFAQTQHHLTCQGILHISNAICSHRLHISRVFMTGTSQW